MPQVAARVASRDGVAGFYQRHRPEQTLLYQIIDEYYPAFTAHLAENAALWLTRCCPSSPCASGS
jgi:hypothetical protein